MIRLRFMPEPWGLERRTAATVLLEELRLAVLVEIDRQRLPKLRRLEIPKIVAQRKRDVQTLASMLGVGMTTSVLHNCYR